MSEQSPNGSSSSPPAAESSSAVTAAEEAESTGADESVQQARSTARLVSASALMAGGTLVSRVLGFGRLMLLTVDSSEPATPTTAAQATRPERRVFPQRLLAPRVLQP